MRMVACKNCGHKYTGHFCPHCGQEAHTERISAAYFLHDIPHSVFHVDKGLLFTLKALFTNPGKMLEQYLAGKRVKHFRPFAYVIILSTICTILIKWIEHWSLSIFLQYHPNPEYVTGSGNHFFEKYISVLIFIMIPVLSLATWLFYRKGKYNYWEHFLINTYMGAQLNVVLLLIKVYGLIKISITHGSPAVNFTLFITLFMCYYGFTFGYLMRPVTKTLAGFAIIMCMNFFLALIYLTGFSLTGIMEPWWNF